MVAKANATIAEIEALIESDEGGPRAAERISRWSAMVNSHQAFIAAVERGIEPDLEFVQAAPSDWPEAVPGAVLGGGSDLAQSTARRVRLCR